MKAGIFFTGTGPIAVVTSYDSFTNPDFVKKFYQKGILFILKDVFILKMLPVL